MLTLKKRKPRRKSEPRRPHAVSKLTRVLGWCVHAYTGLGLVCAALIVALLAEGGANAFRWSFLLMAIATIIDSTDGTLARKVKIKEAVPSFDGRRLDDIIDFLTYTFLPLFLIYRAQILPAGWEPALILPLYASAYGFCQVQAKTDDGYFLGFPSLWNVVAFYLYALPISPWAALGIITLLAVLTFVPTRHLYPSMPGRLNLWTTILGIPWTFLMAWILWRLPQTTARTLDAGTLNLTWVSLFYPAYYLGVSWWISLRYWVRKATAHRRAETSPTEESAAMR